MLCCPCIVCLKSITITPPHCWYRLLSLPTLDPSGIKDTHPLPAPRRFRSRAGPLRLLNPSTSPSPIRPSIHSPSSTYSVSLSRPSPQAAPFLPPPPLNAPTIPHIKKKKKELTDEDDKADCQCVEEREGGSPPTRSVFFLTLFIQTVAAY